MKKRMKKAMHFDTARNATNNNSKKGTMKVDFVVRSVIFLSSLCSTNVS